MELVADFIENAFRFGRDLADFYDINSWTRETYIAAAGFVFGVIASSASLYIRWRSTGRRLRARLFEYIRSEERRLRQARTLVRQVETYPLTSGDLTDSGFKQKSLRPALKKMKWGTVWFVQRRLERTLEKATAQSDLSKRRHDYYEKEKTLTHLVLGAKADAHGESQRALGHFEAILSSDPDDLDALEYASLQLIKLKNSDVALRQNEYIDRLISLSSIANDDLRIARAYRLKALALENLAEPRTNDARSALLRSTVRYPENADPIEVANAWEHLGNVRRELGAFPRARDSYLEAQNKYVVSENPNSVNDLQRVLRLVEETQNQISGGSDYNEELGAIVDDGREPSH